MTRFKNNLFVQVLIQSIPIAYVFIGIFVLGTIGLERNVIEGIMYSTVPLLELIVFRVFRRVINFKIKMDLENVLKVIVGILGLSISLALVFNLVKYSNGSYLIAVSKTWSEFVSPLLIILIVMFIGVSFYLLLKKLITGRI